jgi:aspartyl-tRNA(Asn)/glutamyl-tRNA(Gln) amidotransferase subunit B
MKAYRGTAPEKRAKAVSNWLLGEFTRWLNAEGMEIQQSKVAPLQLVELVEMCHQNAVTGPAAKTIFEEMFRSGQPPGEIAARLGLKQINDVSAVEAAVKAAIAANTQAVVDFRAGKQQSLSFLVGQVMKATKGRANPGVVTEILRRELETG